mmetsp:Transcript_8429/g.26004  ORF Transcript_8429/g.26004 Transcript_8429/m.26004 type:complete len:272 (-) Transcript_8429:459-1274(-)
MASSNLREEAAEAGQRPRKSRRFGGTTRDDDDEAEDDGEDGVPRRRPSCQSPGDDGAEDEARVGGDARETRKDHGARGRRRFRRLRRKEAVGDTQEQNRHEQLEAAACHREHHETQRQQERRAARGLPLCRDRRIHGEATSDENADVRGASDHVQATKHHQQLARRAEPRQSKRLARTPQQRTPVGPEHARVENVSFELLATSSSRLEEIQRRAARRRQGLSSSSLSLRFFRQRPRAEREQAADGNDGGEGEPRRRDLADDAAEGRAQHEA